MFANAAVNGSYGIGVVYLGEEVKNQGKPELKSEEWNCAATLDSFYSAGGRETVSSTEAKMRWDTENLYVRITCRENSPRVLRPVNGNTCNSEWMVRNDRVEVVVAGKEFGNRDYAVFGAESCGKTDAHIEKGMTYFGGDHAILNDWYEEKNEAEIIAISSSEYWAEVCAEEDKWTAEYTVPWRLFGGFPGKDGYFRFQIYRKKNQTNEVLALTPLDLNSNYDSRFDFDPETFIECYFGDTPHVEYVKCACVILPSGIMHWQRPAVLRWPGEEIRKRILELQKSGAKTTEDNLADRIVTVQWWQDVLILEGMDFFPNSRCENSFEKIDPWVQRRLCNEALRRKDTDAACRILDVLISYFRTLTEWWYADGTLGNADEKNWKKLLYLEKTKVTENRIELTFGTEEGEKKAYLIPQRKGARFYIEKKGDFEGESVPFTVEENVQCLSIITAGSRICIKAGGEWKIDIDGKFIINCENIRLYRNNGKIGFDVRQKLLAEEMLYGFGERFDSVNQRGKILTLWHRDAFEGCGCSIGNQSYKNISFFHSTAGYSLFINSFYRIRVDAGRDYEGLRVSTMGDKADFTVFTGSPEENMDAYTNLTGRPLLPPSWVFEPWAGGGVGRWQQGPTHDVVKEMEGVLNRFRNLDIPHSGLYAEGAGWRFKDRYNKDELYKIADFTHERGIHVFSWQYSHIDEDGAAEYLPDCPREELPVTRTPSYTGEKKLPSEIDFSHPRAMELLEAQWKDRMDAGFDGTMVDFGEITPDEAVFYDGRKGDEMHNAYATEYTKAYRILFEKYRGENHVLYSRSAAAGTQKYACQFGGDHLSGFRGLSYSINGGLTAAASGLPFWGVDAGGYDGLCDEESYLRWTEFAAFCPIMRYHGTQPREPWIYSEFASKVYKYYAWLRENLLPYSVETSKIAHRTGMPMMRPLPMMFPGDEEAAAYEDEYMFGESLLVAPVHEEAEEREIYFPEGKWVNFFDHQEIVMGGKAYMKSVPVDRIPVYIREGSFIPIVMNGDLNLGESMSFEKENVMIVSMPGETDYHAVSEMTDCRSIRKNDDYINIYIKGMAHVSYVIILGAADGTSEEVIPENRISAITVNGNELRKSASVNDLRFGSGWLNRGDGSIVMRIQPGEELTINCQ